MRILNRILVTVTALAAASCGDVVRSGRAPVFLVIDLLQGARGDDPTKLASTLGSDVITYVTSGGRCTITTPCATVFTDPGQVTLRLSPKDIGSTGSPTTPSSNNEVTITRYHVEYRRTDGRNTPGVDVPYAFDGAVTGTVPAATTLSLSFVLVRSEAKAESPLVQLQANGVTLPPIVTTIANVTFYGKDQVGNDISATGSIQVDFGDFGDK
jgi:hypothetical protein